MYCFTLFYRLPTTGLHQFNACRRKFSGNCEIGSLFAEFFIYSKHNPVSALRFPFPIRSTFLGRACSGCRKRRHPTWQGPNPGIVEQGVARNDIGADPTPSEQLEKIVITRVLNAASM